MTLLIELCKGLQLEVEGTIIPEEPEVNINEGFQITEANVYQGSAYDLLEWADAQKGRALVKLDELCIEELNDQK